MTQSCQLLRRARVEQRTALSRSSIYARLDEKSKYYDPSFPRPIKLGKGANPPVAWVESEVDAWIRLRIEQSRGAV